MDIVGQNGNDGIHYDESEETEKNINRIKTEMME